MVSCPCFCEEEGIEILSKPNQFQRRVEDDTLIRNSWKIWPSLLVNRKVIDEYILKDRVMEILDWLRWSTWEKIGSWEEEKKQVERKLNLVRRKIVRWNVNRWSVTDCKGREIEDEVSVWGWKIYKKRFIWVLSFCVSWAGIVKQIGWFEVILPF